MKEKQKREADEAIEERDAAIKEEHERLHQRKGVIDNGMISERRLSNEGFVVKPSRTEEKLLQKKIKPDLDSRVSFEFSQAVKDLLFEMQKAAADDKRAFSENRPAFNKLLLAEKVYTELRKLPI